MTDQREPATCGNCGHDRRLHERGACWDGYTECKCPGLPVTTTDQPDKRPSCTDPNCGNYDSLYRHVCDRRPSLLEELREACHGHFNSAGAKRGRLERVLKLLDRIEDEMVPKCDIVCKRCKCVLEVTENSPDLYVDGCDSCLVERPTREQIDRFHKLVKVHLGFAQLEAIDRNAYNKKESLERIAGFIMEDLADLGLAPKVDA
jgi:hypothetical protein